MVHPEQHIQGELLAIDCAKLLLNEQTDLCCLLAQAMSHFEKQVLQRPVANLWKRVIYMQISGSQNGDCSMTNVAHPS